MQKHISYILQNGIPKGFAIICKIFLAGVISIAILSTFSVAYYHTGLRIPCESGTTDYHWEPNMLISTMKEGYSWITTDENGYNNASVPDSVDILLMGSSHMEAIEVSQNENTAARLNELFPELNTYNVGISGHTVYRCVNNVESAINEYTPTRYIIIETNNISLNLEEMEAVVQGTSRRLPASNNGKLMTLLQKIPAFKPLYTQVDVWKNQGSEVANVIDSSYTSDLYAPILESFLSIVGKAANNHGIKAIIFYDPPQHVAENGILDYAHTDEEITLFRKACEDNGILFVDLTGYFDSFYQNNRILVHGFCNTAVGSGHLNKYGHQIIAEKLASVILEDLQQ